MQFIPSTWRKWSTDGNGDGLGDPQNLDDAAMAAARSSTRFSQAEGGTASSTKRHSTARRPRTPSSVGHLGDPGT